MHHIMPDTFDALDVICVDLYQLTDPNRVAWFKGVTRIYDFAIDVLNQKAYLKRRYSHEAIRPGHPAV